MLPSQKHGETPTAKTRMVNKMGTGRLWGLSLGETLQKGNTATSAQLLGLQGTHMEQQLHKTSTLGRYIFLGTVPVLGTRAASFPSCQDRGSEGPAQGRLRSCLLKAPTPVTSCW